MSASSLSDPAQRWLLRCPTQNHGLLGSPVASSTADALPDKIKAGDGQFGIRFHELTGGRSAGMTSLVVDTGAVVACILPDRGMGIWKCWSGDLECGWQSPVAGPVHPQFVPLNDASGIGWLEGFDELLVRCGLLSNGAPEFEGNGIVKHPLHGRIANLPAHRLEVTVDEKAGIMDVIGVVSEARFLVYSLELQTRYRFRIGSPMIEVVDTVTNRSSKSGSMQMLYHINVGQPIVQSGSSIHAAYRTLTPRDARAMVDRQRWDRCDGPTSGYTEQVYYISPMANEHQWTESMLVSPDRNYGFAVQFDTRTLPYLNIWKNTVAVEDGYVVGIEPASGFPNTRSVEEEAGRVIALQGGESKSFRLKLQLLDSANAVADALRRIQSLQTIPGHLSEKPFHS